MIEVPGRFDSHKSMFVLKQTRRYSNPTWYDTQKKYFAQTFLGSSNWIIVA